MRKPSLDTVARLIGVGLLTAAGVIGLGASPPALAAAPTTPGAVFKDCPDCIDMVVVPAGRFQMGSTPEARKIEGVPRLFGDRESPMVDVTIAKPFALSKTEITRGQFIAFAKATNRPQPADCYVYDKAKDNWGGGAGLHYSYDHTPFPQTDNDPAVCISWQDAHDYAAWMSKKTGKPYHLPSEEEWEYAAKGGTTTSRYWGDDAREICDKASVMTTATYIAIGQPDSWADKLVCTSDKAWTLPVGSFDPNPFGLYDMLGSAWEWVADCGTPDHKGAPTDGSAVTAAEGGDCTKRVTKGGAFHSEPWLVRASTRGAGLDPTAHPIASGFRIARDLD
jgi:sulfatase modifying factor 1